MGFLEILCFTDAGLEAQREGGKGTSAPFWGGGMGNELQRSSPVSLKYSAPEPREFCSQPTAVRKWEGFSGDRVAEWW